MDATAVTGEPLETGGRDGGGRCGGVAVKIGEGSVSAIIDASKHVERKYPWMRHHLRQSGTYRQRVAMGQGEGAVWVRVGERVRGGWGFNLRGEGERSESSELNTSVQKKLTKMCAIVS